MAKIETKRALSGSVEDYLKTLYAIEEAGDAGTTGALADRLGIAPASVTGMLKKLAAHDPPLVCYEKRKGARLTDEGRSRALGTVRQHRLIELFLHEVLGFEWDAVHEEADRLEHVISDDLEAKIDERLGHPTVDPHGHPIPAKDGTMPEDGGVRLADLKAGDEGSVARVPDGDGEMLRYLAGAGLVPGARVALVDRGPFDGPFTVRVAGAEATFAVSLRVAANVFVVKRETDDYHTSGSDR
jgi:DtxR family Mn-dependent transcriptional regulator